jgi:hypothetical protein
MEWEDSSHGIYNKSYFANAMLVNTKNITLFAA